MLKLSVQGVSTWKRPVFDLSGYPGKCDGEIGFEPPQGSRLRDRIPPDSHSSVVNCPGKLENMNTSLARLLVLAVVFAGAGAGPAFGQDYADPIRTVDLPSDPKDTDTDYYAFDTPPSSTKRVMPEYPMESREARVEGKVYVEVTVDIEGRVIRARVIDSETTAPLTRREESLKKALAQWTFEPMKIDGESARSRVEVPILVKEDPERKGYAAYGFVEIKSWLIDPKDGDWKKERTPAEVATRIMPEDSRYESGREVTVVLKAKVSETGQVSDVEISQPLMMSELAHAAVIAAKQWEFSPAFQRDKPVKSKILIPFEFGLN